MPRDMDAGAMRGGQRVRGEAAAASASRWSRGILAMALSAVAFSTMAALVKQAGRTIPNQELVALRSLASILPILALFWWRGVPLRAMRPGWLGLRGLLGYIAISCWFLSLNRLALPDAVMIQYTSPVFTALMAPFILHEPSRPRDRWALLIALLGVAVVVRPGMGVTMAGALIGLAGAVSSAGAYMTVRALRHSDHPFMVMLSFPAVASALSLMWLLAGSLAGESVPLLARAAGWVWPDARGWWLIAGIALMTAVGQMFLTYGLTREAAGPATVATYFAVVVSLPLGILMFDQWPDRWMLLGGAMVVSAIGWLALGTDRVVPPPAGAGAGQVTDGLD
jgi:drug/metabolite transporter (DMT)-like permease